MSSMHVCVEGTSTAVIEAETESSYIYMDKVYYTIIIIIIIALIANIILIIKKSLKIVLIKLVVPKGCMLLVHPYYVADKAVSRME